MNDNDGAISSPVQFPAALINSGETCANCRFSWPLPQGNQNLLVCRRYPPEFYIAEQQMQRPAMLPSGQPDLSKLRKPDLVTVKVPASDVLVVLKTGWCGEFAVSKAAVQ